MKYQLKMWGDSDRMVRRRASKRYSVVMVQLERPYGSSIVALEVGLSTDKDEWTVVLTSDGRVRQVARGKFSEDGVTVESDRS